MDGDDQCDLDHCLVTGAAAECADFAMSLIFDAHLDLAMNALEWNRDLTRPIAEIRAREQGKTDKPDRGRGTVSLPEMRRGGAGQWVASLIARYVRASTSLYRWHSPTHAL